MGKNIKENFDVILEEMFGSDKMCFDTLLNVTRMDAIEKVRYWCRRYEIDYSEAYEDVTQIVMLRVWKKCVPQFFCRNGIENLNTSADEYWYWVQSICKSCAYSYAKKLYSREFREVPEDENESAPEIPETDTDKLNRAFNVVMKAGCNVYKPLTWLVQSLIVLQNNMTRIESNEELISIFENATLDRMFDVVLSASKQFEWMNLDAEGVETIRKGLDKIHESGKRMGDMQYGDFYMKAGAKKSVSDWINRMDAKITDEEEREKKQPEDKKKDADDNNNNDNDEKDGDK